MIVDKLRSMVESWDDARVCDMCWRFIHARRDHANLYRPKDCKCGVTFFLEKVSEDTKYREDDYGSHRDYTDFIISGFMGMESKLSEAYDNELEGSGKYDKYIRQVIECTKERMSGDDCLDGLFPMQIRLTHAINKKDQNYDGVDFNATYRKRWT